MRLSSLAALRCYCSRHGCCREVEASVRFLMLARFFATILNLLNLVHLGAIGWPTATMHVKFNCEYPLMQLNFALDACGWMHQRELFEFSRREARDGQLR